MSPPSAREVSHGIYGAWRLARFDATAMVWFDRSIDGVWRSFWAPAIAYPGILFLIAQRITPEEQAQSGLARILLVESIGYVIGCVAFPLVALLLCRWLERERQWLDLVIAYNWATVVETVFVVAIAAILALGIVPEGMAEFIGLAKLIALIVYEWFIARVTLEAGGVAAAVIVLIDFVLTFGLDAVTRSLY
jgi:hypothetical protein